MTQTLHKEVNLKINALIEVINKESPIELNRFKDSHPLLAPYLTQGLTLGMASNDGQEVQLISLATVGLRSTFRRSECLAKLIGSRLRLSRRISFIGSMVAGVTSTGIVAAVLKDASSAAIAGSVVSLLANSVSGVSQYLESSGMGKASGLADTVNCLIRIAVNAEQKLKDIQIWQLTGSERQMAIQIIQEANQLAAELRAIDLAIREP